ncbi:hypothetical protein [Neobacillus thermocopriae]|uniref:DUF3139 domain-containing protein n=1 Tax=Neobacillus thermocopriae TaxID=1215031 RepID=A0A6B3TQL4_9BACI|nr:hypothetical protein [Neobacillus thermocopriae]MED3623152.1 hypothetical protein [Neobacillus thermocopriae]MED3715047.1 hypothetical protein [Neobacillus thermocopriae]NEX78902.1 hypothetical protein [Neobacillus thermocopriae]
MKKIGTVILILLIFIGMGFSYIQYKKSNVKKSVTKYLTTVANLPGDKNWMVSIKLKNDDKTYYYYKSKNKVILESYVENGVEHVQ